MVTREWWLSSRSTSLLTKIPRTPRSSTCRRDNYMKSCFHLLTSVVPVKVISRSPWNGFFSEPASNSPKLLQWEQKWKAGDVEEPTLWQCGELWAWSAWIHQTGWSTWQKAAAPRWFLNCNNQTLYSLLWQHFNHLPSTLNQEPMVLWQWVPLRDIPWKTAQTTSVLQSSHQLSIQIIANQNLLQPAERKKKASLKAPMFYNPLLRYWSSGGFKETKKKIWQTARIKLYRGPKMGLWWTQ